MKNISKRIITLLLLVVMTIPMLALTGCSNTKNETIEITDMSGTVVTIPRYPQKVAAVSSSTGSL